MSEGWRVKRDIKGTEDKTYHGACHCGAVCFSAQGPLRAAVACHCEDCLRLAGYSWAATQVAEAGFTLTSGEESIDWYQSSDIAKRGFCKKCHAHMFYVLLNSGRVSIAVGMMDARDELSLAGQIYRASLTDDLHLTADTPELDR